MTEFSRYLLDLASRKAEVYSALPGARAGMLSGSAAAGDSDGYSDIDMRIYYDALPATATGPAGLLQPEPRRSAWLPPHCAEP